MYSSYFDYVNDTPRKESFILDKKYFPHYFNTKGDFLKEIISWLQFR
jgi:hypothetical protein